MMYLASQCIPMLGDYDFVLRPPFGRRKRYRRGDDK